MAWALALTVSVAPAVSATRPNLLLVTVDTLRADHLSSYGYPQEITPTLDGLAAKGILFEDVLTTIGKTGPAFASLFTSLYPPTHGARRNGVPARPDVPILAEILQREGYATAAFISNWTLKHRLSGLARGFDTYDDTFNRKRHSFGLNERDAPAVTQAVLEWLAEHRSPKDARPLFLWVHYSEPHSPYKLQAGPRRPMPPDQRRGWNKRWKYATEVHYVDHWIGTLLESLKPYLPEDSTYLVFLSDHGESLGEHGYWGHGKNVHWPNLKIPLIVTGPGVPVGVRESRPASIVDVLPTMLHLLGVEGPPRVDGIVLPTLGGTSIPADRPRYAVADRITAVGKKSRARYEDPLMISWQSQRVKVIYDFSRRSIHYFDLAQDPGEEEALASPPIDTRPPIRRRLANWYNNLPKYEAISGELSPEDIEQLRSLGYVGP